MKRYFGVLGLVIVMGLLTAIVVGAQSSQSVQLAFLVDGSGSIGSSEFTIMRNGIAAALEDTACVPHDGTMELTVIQFSSNARTEVQPTVITSANVGTIANQIRNMPKLGGGTQYAPPIDMAIANVTGSPNFGSFDRQVINMTTDGAPSDSSQIDAMRQRAMNAGFEELDAEGIGLSNVTSTPEDLVTLEVSSIAILEQLVYPKPATVHPPTAWPPASTGWVRVVDDVNEFAQTVCEKFQVTTGPGPTPTPTPPPDIPEPITLILFGTGSAAIGLYANRRRKNHQQTNE